MLPETEKILTKFREINRKAFAECTQDFKPTKSYGLKNGSAYGEFDEIEEIYQLMYSLTLQLDQQIFYGNYSSAYSNPLEPIDSIKETSEYIKININRLISLNEKYSNQLMPIYFTLENFQKTDKMLDYVLNQTEIKNEFGDIRLDKIKDELIGIKTLKRFRKKQFQILGLAFFYIIFLLGPTLLIILFWESEQNKSYFQLSLFLFPIMSFIYDRNSFFEIFKFTFRKKYRVEIRESYAEELKKNYA